MAISASESDRRLKILGQARRFRLEQARVRSTTQSRGSSCKPEAPSFDNLDRHLPNASRWLGPYQQPPVSVTIWRLRRPLIFAAASPGSRLCRQGCGAKLIEAVAAIARERGCARLYWTTKEDNTTARSLYDSIARFKSFIRYDYPLETL
jgi:Acetyltransferase (GNAT) family